ncbi:hypothetical protein [Ruegeria sp. SCP11]|uniref:hypothetical protein n=1 Tax=Ruegeria sp. SCP11 TaxID=3141378 RepID=UPI003335CD3E
MTIKRSLLSRPRSTLYRPVGAQVPYGRGSRGFSLAQTFVGLLSRMRNAAIREYRIRRDFRHVSQLDKRMLKDVGLDPDLYHKDLRYGRDANWRF